MPERRAYHIQSPIVIYHIGLMAIKALAISLAVLYRFLWTSAQCSLSHPWINSPLYYISK